MNVNLDLADVLSKFPSDCRPTAVEALGNAGGFSGAQFWRLTTPRGLLCLRRWPSEHPSPDKLLFIHAVLRHVDQVGFYLVPLPIAGVLGESFVQHGDHLWELTPWLPGAPWGNSRPTSEIISAAMIAIAQFHRAAESFLVPKRDVGPAPGIVERRARLAALRSGDLARLTAAIDEQVWPVGAAVARRLAELVPASMAPVAAQLDEAAMLSVPCQPCMRDVWSDHVLLVGGKVTGLVDFGAMRVENVACDVARLLGSLADDDRAAWDVGVRSYESIRPLSHAEHTLVAAFDRSSVLLSGLNWIDWIYCQQRRFENSGEIVGRLERSTRRLEVLNRSWPLAVE